MLELVVGLCGGITASLEKMVALVSFFLDAVGAVPVKFVLIDFKLRMLDLLGKGSRILLELISEVDDVFRIHTMQFTEVKCE